MQYAPRAVKMVGFKLVLLAVSFGALATALPGPAEASLADASWGGMKLLHLILGTFGAGVSLWFVPQLNGSALGKVVTCGLVCSVVGTPAFAWFVTWYTEGKTAIPSPVENLLALAAGALGVYVIPGLQRLGKAFEEDPAGFLGRLFRRGPPPPGGQGGQP